MPDSPSASLQSNKRRPGCDSCRVRHLKCDRKPQCSQCARRGQECIRSSNIRFRHASFSSSRAPGPEQSHYSFGSEQKWVKTVNKTIRFVDETEEVGALYTGDVSSEDDDALEQRGFRPRAQSVSTFRPHADSFSTVASHEGIFSPLARFSHPTPPTFVEQSTQRSSSIDIVDPTTDQLAFYIETPLLPLQNAREAELLQHFVAHLAPTFDLGDQDHTFAGVIPQQAAICPPLLRVVLSLAEHDIRRRSDSPLSSRGPAQYHNSRQTLSLLLAALAANSDENLLASLILLLHQDVVHASADDGGSMASDLHTFETMSLVWSRLLAVESAAEAIRHPVFWAFVRQEIYISVMYQRRPTCFTHYGPSRLDVECGLGPADDYTWANRICWHLLNVLDYCFGEDKEPATHSRLVEYAEAWMRARPASFNPIFMQDKSRRTGEAPHGGKDGGGGGGGSRDGRASLFPDVLLLNDSAVLGLQYYHLVLILLIAYDPGIPRVGFEQRAAARAMDEALRADVGIVCGIAESLGDINPAHLAACMAVALAGDRFEDETELQALFRILTQTEEKYGWSTLAAQHDLKRSFPEAFAAA